jgi:hypothetical protein
MRNDDTYGGVGWALRARVLLQKSCGGSALRASVVIGVRSGVSEAVSVDGCAAGAPRAARHLRRLGGRDGGLVLLRGEERGARSAARGAPQAGSKTRVEAPSSARAQEQRPHRLRRLVVVVGARQPRGALERRHGLSVAARGVQARAQARVAFAPARCECGRLARITHRLCCTAQLAARQRAVGQHRVRVRVVLRIEQAGEATRQRGRLRGAACGASCDACAAATPHRRAPRAVQRTAARPQRCSRCASAA